MFKNLGVMVGGSIASQLLLLLTIPIITRMFGQQAYGEYGQFMSLLNIVTPVAALCLPIAILIQNNTFSVVKIINVASCLYFITSSFLLFAVLITNLLYPSLPALFYMLPFSVFLSGLYEISRQQNIKISKFAKISLAGVLSSFFATVIKVLSGLFTQNPLFLIVGNILGLFVNINQLGLPIKKINLPSIKLIIHTIKKNKDITKYRTMQTLLSASAINIPIFIYSSFFSTDIIGQYYIALSLAGLPIVLIGKSITDVFYPKWLAAIENNENLSSALVKSCFTILSISIFLYLPIYFISEFAFKIYLGEGWDLVSDFFNFMLISSIGVIVTRPLVALIPLLQMQKQFFIYELISFSVKICTLFLLVNVFTSSVLVVLGYSLMSFLLSLALFYFVSLISSGAKP
ncbi:lipopolysaccharide biosynthesis protein [Thalassotalea aquiviva]|uniref:lipopolysaccharide biosynthesis protein n=1 Tax=Thalassotalea aquiviva TaxID=3242415 RepID=UPI00352AD597